MRRRYLIIPGNNSLSHVAKALSIARELEWRGHEALLAVAAGTAGFLERLGIRHRVISDIQEADGAPFPTAEWFRSPERISRCMRHEVALIRDFKPDAVLGVFRFTAPYSTRIAGVAYFSVACGCMLSTCPDALGFCTGAPGSEKQRKILDGFFQYAARSMNRAAEEWRLPLLLTDARQALSGDFTFLWDVPEFQPIPSASRQVHVGPLSLADWPEETGGLCDSDGRPKVVISFGTCTFPSEVIARLVGIACRLGCHVDLVTGGHEPPGDLPGCGAGRLHVHRSVRLATHLSDARLLITHGGQLTVLEALRSEVPVLVVPSQPEQAHNGVCLERIGCGKRLVPSMVFQGEPRAFHRAFMQRGIEEIACEIERAMTDARIRTRLRGFSKAFEAYGGAADLASAIEALRDAAANRISARVRGHSIRFRPADGGA